MMQEKEFSMPVSISFSTVNFTLPFPQAISPHNAFVPRRLWLTQTLELHQSAPLSVMEQKVIQNVKRRICEKLTAHNG